MVKIIALFLCSLLPWLSFAANQTPAKCMVVIDAGSTGSRAYLYRYQLTNDNRLDNLWVVAKNKISPALATLEPSAEEMNDYFTRLFDGISISDTVPVYLYATGGMRLISHQKQAKLYQQLTQWFATQPLYQLREAKTITGQQEGRFAWQAVNYLLNKQAGENVQFGVMDFGGASVQISLASASKNTSQTILSDSFLGLGQEATLMQYLNEPSCFAKNYPVPNGQLGTGLAVLCKEKIAGLVNTVQNVNSSINKVALSKVKQWYVLGGITYLAQDKRVALGDVFSMQALLTKAQQTFCGDWSKLNKQYPNDRYLYSACFASAYFSAVLNDGYGLAMDTRLRAKVNQLDPEWSEGVVIEKALMHK